MAKYTTDSHSYDVRFGAQKGQKISWGALLFVSFIPLALCVGLVQSNEHYILSSFPGCLFWLLPVFASIAFIYLETKMIAGLSDRAGFILKKDEIEFQSIAGDVYTIPKSAVKRITFFSPMFVNAGVLRIETDQGSLISPVKRKYELVHALEEFEYRYEFNTWVFNSIGVILSGVFLALRYDIPFLIPIAGGITLFAALRLIPIRLMPLEKTRFVRRRMTLIAACMTSVFALVFCLPNWSHEDQLYQSATQSKVFGDYSKAFQIYQALNEKVEFAKFENSGAWLLVEHPELHPQASELAEIWATRAVEHSKAFQELHRESADTLACAKMARGDTAGAIELARKYSLKHRVARFKAGGTCASANSRAPASVSTVNSVPLR